MSRKFLTREQSAKVRYVCCIAIYYDPEDKEKRPVRTTAAILDRKIEKIIDKVEFFADTSLEDTGKAILKLAKKYNATPSMRDEPFPLEKDKNGGYKFRTIMDEPVLN